MPVVPPSGWRTNHEAITQHERPRLDTVDDSNSDSGFGSDLVHNLPQAGLSPSESKNKGSGHSSRSPKAEKGRDVSEEEIIEQYKHISQPQDRTTDSKREGNVLARLQEKCVDQILHTQKSVTLPSISQKQEVHLSPMLPSLLPLPSRAGESNGILRSKSYKRPPLIKKYNVLLDADDSKAVYERNGEIGLPHLAPPSFGAKKFFGSPLRQEKQEEKPRLEIAAADRRLVRSVSLLRKQSVPAGNPVLVRKKERTKPYRDTPAYFINLKQT